MKKIGLNKLYASERSLFVYPTKESAKAISIAYAIDEKYAIEEVKVITRTMCVNVSYLKIDQPWMMLQSKGAYVEILAGDNIGWIIRNNGCSSIRRYSAVIPKGYHDN